MWQVQWMASKKPQNRHSFIKVQQSKYVPVYNVYINIYLNIQIERFPTDTGV